MIPLARPHIASGTSPTSDDDPCLHEVKLDDSAAVGVREAREVGAKERVHHHIREHEV
jgi:hypothetical protein